MTEQPDWVERYLAELLETVITGTKSPPAAEPASAERPLQPTCITCGGPVRFGRMYCYQDDPNCYD